MQIAQHAEQLIALLIQNGLFAENIADEIVNVYSGSDLSEETYLYTITLSVTP